MGRRKQGAIGRWHPDWVTLGLALGVVLAWLLLPLSGALADDLRPSTPAEWNVAFDEMMDVCMGEADLDYEAPARYADVGTVLIPVPTSAQYSATDAVMLESGYGRFTARPFTADAALHAEAEAYRVRFVACRTAARDSIPYPEFELRAEATRLQRIGMERHANDPRIADVRNSWRQCMADAGFVLADGDPIAYLESLAGEMAGVSGGEVDGSTLPAMALGAIQDAELAVARADVECRLEGRAVHAAVAREIEADLLDDYPELASAIFEWIDEG